MEGKAKDQDKVHAVPAASIEAEQESKKPLQTEGERMSVLLTLNVPWVVSAL